VRKKKCGDCTSASLTYILSSHEQDTKTSKENYGEGNKKLEEATIKRINHGLSIPHDSTFRHHQVRRSNLNQHLTLRANLLIRLPSPHLANQKTARRRFFDSNIVTRWEELIYVLVSWSEDD